MVSAQIEDSKSIKNITYTPRLIQMIVRHIGEDDFHRIVENAYNPPEISEAFTENDFGFEWRSVRTRLIETLTSVCPMQCSFDDCVVVASDWGLSRHIQFEVRRIEYLEAPGLAGAVQELVRTQVPNYEFLMEHDLYLGDQWPDCAVLFRAGETLGYEDKQGALAAIIF